MTSIECEESGEWTVDINEDGTGVIMEFNHVSDDGIETFTTAMPPNCARDFAEAILTKVDEIE